MTTKTSKFPKQIQKMIATRRARGYNASRITREINDSKTAKKLDVEYKTSQIAARMAWHTMTD